jgi:endonuclease YncB( thermonuclease family)
VKEQSGVPAVPWLGGGGFCSGFYSEGKAPSLRQTQLTRDQISEVIQRGRPGTLSLSGKRILFWGIDAPIGGQPCYAGNKAWDCASASVKTLLNIAGDQKITCGGQIDQFGRVFAVGRAGEVDANRALIAAGMPIEFPRENTDYVAGEPETMAKGIGLWRGPFIARADYREMLAGHSHERWAPA